MALLMKNFSKLMRNRNYKGNKRHESSKRRTKRNCYNCGKNGHFIANCPYEKRKDNKEKKYFTKDKKFFKKKQGGEAHLGKEWDSDDGSSNSDEEEVATLTFNKTSLFPNLKDGKNITHTCLMAKGGKRMVKTIPCSSPKYTTSDDESTSSSSSENDNDIDMTAILKNLDKNATAKFNELMEELNEKNDLLEKQEDLLILEKKRNLELKELITKQEEKSKALDKELVESKETNTSLKSANVALQDELVCLNKSLELQFDTLLSNASTSQHDPSINSPIAQPCLRCKDIDVDACATNVKLIESLKVKITSLEGEAQQKKKYLEEEKLKYARGAYLNSRRPNIKDGIGFQCLEKHNARVKINGHEFPKFVKEAASGRVTPGAGHPRVPGGQSARTGRQSARNPRVADFQPLVPLPPMHQSFLLCISMSLMHHM
jgi:hypothetical protein